MSMGFVVVVIGIKCWMRGWSSNGRRCEDIVGSLLREQYSQYHWRTDMHVSVVPLRRFALDALRCMRVSSPVSDCSARWDMWADAARDL